MVLVDTSVWVSHLRETHLSLADLLNNGEVACHQFVIGELACGNLTKRTAILSLLQALPIAILAEHEEVLALIENPDLAGKGLGYVDVHLLASAVLTGLSLWTLDRKLERAADILHCRHREIS
jgi:predicted nucleic acid-binding protein